VFDVKAIAGLMTRWPLAAAVAALRAGCVILPSGPTVVTPPAAVLQWLGGACDARSQINVLAQGTSISMAVRTDGKIGAGCTPLGIYRTVRITFREPIDGRTLELAGHG
jgi:hypothetical protein